jgi:hypothetical protein
VSLANYSSAAEIRRQFLLWGLSMMPCHCHSIWQHWLFQPNIGYVLVENATLESGVWTPNLLFNEIAKPASKLLPRRPSQQPNHHQPCFI